MEQQCSSLPKFTFGNIKALHEHVLKSMKTGQLASSMVLEYEGPESLNVLLEQIFTFCTSAEPSLIEAYKKFVKETGIQVDNPPICEPLCSNSMNSAIAIDNSSELTTETTPSISPCMSQDEAERKELLYMKLIEDLTNAGAFDQDSEDSTHVDFQNPTKIKEFEDVIPRHESKEITNSNCESLNLGEVLDFVPVDVDPQLHLDLEYSQLEMIIKNNSSIIIEKTMSSDEESFYSAETNLSSGSDQFEVDDEKEEAENVEDYLGEKVTSDVTDPLNDDVELDHPPSILCTEKLTTGSTDSKVQVQSSRKRRLSVNASETSQVTAEDTNFKEDPTDSQPNNNSEIINMKHKPKDVAVGAKKEVFYKPGPKSRKKIPTSSQIDIKSVNNLPAAEVTGTDDQGRWIANEEETQMIKIEASSESSVSKSTNKRRKLNRYYAVIYSSDEDDTYAPLPRPLSSLDDEEENSTSSSSASSVSKSINKRRKLNRSCPVIYSSDDDTYVPLPRPLSSLDDDEENSTSSSSESSVSKSINKRRKPNRSCAIYSSDDDDVPLPRPLSSLGDVQTSSDEENSTSSSEEESTTLSDSDHSSLSSYKTNSPSKAAPTQEINIKMMNQEMKKSAPNLKLLKKLLDQTRTSRMEYLLSTEYDVQKGFEKYPALSLYSLMKYEFSRMDGSTTNRLADLEAQLKVDMDTVTIRKRLLGRKRNKIWEKALEKINDKSRLLSPDAKNVLGMICLCFTIAKDATTKLFFELRNPGEPVEKKRLLCPTLVVMDIEEIFKETANDMWIYCDGRKCISVPNVYQGILTIYSMYYVFNMKYNRKLKVLFVRFDEIISAKS